MGGRVKPRRILFWLHFTTGVSAGAVVLVMSVTGVLLAFQRPLTAFAERGMRVQAAPGLERLSLNALAKNAGAEPDGAVLRADPSAPVGLNYGRTQTVFFDPYTGASLGEGAKRFRVFFRLVEDCHRWLSFPEKRRALGRSLTGAANAAFFLLATSGLFLWWPRRRTRAALLAVALPSWKGHGKARNWNWHNAFGVWSAPFLLVIAATGMVMSYPWANNLLYIAVGEKPPSSARRAEKPSDDPKNLRASLDALAAAAKKQAPAWRVITLRIPRGGAAATALIEENGAPFFLRSNLTLNASTGAVVKWEPASSWSRGRRLRVLARFTHTGETGGAIGQIIAALASLAGALLAWTGLALAWRRLRPARVSS